jgi:hypothetical protein
MTPRVFMAAVLADLDAYAAGNKACRVRTGAAQDGFSALDALLAPGAGHAAILLWAGDDAGEEGEAPEEDGYPQVKQRLDLLVGRPLDLGSGRPERAMLGQAGDGTGLLDVVAALRERMLTLRLPTDGDDNTGALRYLGCEALAVNDMPMSAYRLRFQLRSAVVVGEARA